MSANVIIYTKSFCPFCVKAKQILNTKNINYEEIKIDSNPEERAKMLKKSNGVHTVPQIFINEFHVGGCTELMALESKNELDTLLQ